MKVSYNWLREFVDIKKIDPLNIGEKLTLHTCELEELIFVEKQLSHTVTGKILSITPHPKSDGLMKASVDTGTFGTRQILFGKALGVQVGDVVPVALPGATLPNGITIEAKKMGGELSEGMICIASELGYKNDSLWLFSKNTKLGVFLPEVNEEFGDILFDIDNKSLTHRPDMWGVRGFAREISAIYGIKKSLPVPKHHTAVSNKKYPIKIETKGCHRFCAVRISGIQVQPSDMTTQIRLENLGIRAISNLVDITNCVLSEYGQPMHVFDASKVSGSIIVRQAKKGESLEALDGETYTLEPSDIVIADEKKVLSIAGIMGGYESSVTDTTTDIIFESANFDAATIRRTSSRLGLRSDSSVRFEKSLDSENCESGMWKAVELTLKSNPKAQIETEFNSVYPSPQNPYTIKLSPDKVRSISGIELPDKEIIKILESVDFKTVSKKNVIEVQIPSFRATKDIEMEEDLIEEVVRLYGFDKIETRVPSLPIKAPKRNLLRETEWNIRDYFSISGFSEVMNYSFVNEKDKDFTGQSNYVAIKNPLSNQQSHLRVSLVSNILKNLESELRAHKKLSYFELGKIFIQKKNDLPDQRLHLGVLMGEISNKENDLFYTLKSEIEIFLTTHFLNIHFVPSSMPEVYAHPVKSAYIMANDIRIGEIFVIHPSKNNIKNASLVFAEIDLQDLQPLLEKSLATYTQVSPYPTMFRDISILTNKKNLMGNIQSEIVSVSKFVQSVELFDEFEDDKRFGKDRKNLAFHLSFGSNKKTLDEAEVEEDFQRIVASLKKKFGAELRT